MTPDVIRKSFKKTGLSVANDGTEGDMLFHDDNDPFEGFSVGEIDTATQLAENISS